MRLALNGLIRPHRKRRKIGDPARPEGQTSNFLLRTLADWNDYLLRLSHSLDADGLGRFDELAVKRDHRLAVPGFPKV